MVFDDHDAHCGHSAAFDGEYTDTAQQSQRRRCPAVNRKFRPIGGWRPPERARTILVMFWMIVLVVLCPLVALGAERLAARIPLDAKQ
jgi:hypothetical protein